MDRPEIAYSMQTGNFKTNYHDLGVGYPVVMLHGSGPGVTAWANWGKVFPIIGKSYRIVAPDLAGFGFTERVPGAVYNMNNWVRQTMQLLDSLHIDKANFVGNSFGGALALTIAVKYPERVNKLVLMGSMGVSFPITYGLDRGWGYTPSYANMEELLEIFTYDHSFATEDLIQSRYQSSMQPGFQESFSSMFPAPRQQGVESMAGNQNYIHNIKQPTLVCCGREDRVIPNETSYKLASLIDNSQLHIFSHCGHWTMIEKAVEFSKLTLNFFEE
jgi:2-hydroxymuconate-semialdehyde hydrolase